MHTLSKRTYDSRVNALRLSGTDLPSLFPCKLNDLSHSNSNVGEDSNITAWMVAQRHTEQQQQ